LEKYAGALPLWMAPTQIRILPITDAHMDYSTALKAKLEALGMRVELDGRNETIGYKIRDARMQRVPYMLIIGDNEVANNSVSVRNRKQETTDMSVADFINKAADEIARRDLTV
ncbi:MAG: threonine--tRNA ligase, partial [Clostridia bacterium]|nr:threonine--tRNA ligase [Clostridia bacterium]